MKIGNTTVTIFKMDNRQGYAAVCGHSLTEGRTQQEAYARMVKAKARLDRKKKRK